MYGFMLAAFCSNSGKTVITSGVAGALSRRSVIAPFKCGPDYVDTALLSRAARRPAYNLDTILLGEDGVKNVFATGCADVDGAVVEGVMGFFDGLDPVTFEGSSYHVAKTLNLPVILIINAQGLAASVASIAEGVRKLAKNAHIAGVILNKVGSARHEEILRTSLSIHAQGIEVFGAVPVIDDLIVPSRKLGLVLPDDTFYEKAADAAEKYIDIERMAEIFPRLKPDSLSFRPQPVPASEPVSRNPKTAFIAYDEAFCFYYKSMFDELIRNGYEIKRFSPLRNEGVEGADLVILGGGYVDLYAEKLAGAENTRRSLLRFHTEGGKIIGEGGGFVYMTKSLNGYPMLGIFDTECETTSKRQHLGYVNLELPDGQSHRGHVFNYIKITKNNEKYIGKAKKLSTGELFEDGIMRNGAYGGFTHMMEILYL